MFEETEKLIEILKTGYIICLVLTIMFFLISVLLFFVFDIKQVFLVRTGRAAKRDIRKLEEENFNTGRLSQYKAGNRNFSNSGSLENSQELPKTEQMSQNPVPVPPAPPNVSGVQESFATTVLGQNDTTVLNNEFTTVLNNGATTVLSQGMQGAIHETRKFRVVKKEMHIHTEEIL